MGLGAKPLAEALKDMMVFLGTYRVVWRAEAPPKLIWVSPCLPPQRMSRAVEQAAPWLILAGSGGIADVLAALVGQPHLLVPQVTEKQFREKFPSECFSWEAIVHWTELVCTAGGCYSHLLPLSSRPPLGGDVLPESLAGLACTLSSYAPRNYPGPCVAERPDS